MNEPTRAARHCTKCGTILVPREDGGRARDACPREGCGFVLYENPTPVVAAIVQRGDDVILVRAKNFPEKWFGLVTGFLELGERPEDGIVREVKEELGLDATKPTLVGVYPFFPMKQIIIAYHLHVTGEVTLGDELADFKAIPISKVRPWPFGTGEALNAWLSSVRGPAA
jgi:NADH pyrophosphatase NudC (nudix superfamily)